MELWASTIPQVQFICVCVESKQVAIMFHQMFSFKHAKNGYIPSNEYMPRGFGQLGCSGFIISDINGNFITRKLSAYLQYGENAFRNVEKILNSELHVMNNDTTTAPPVASADIDLTEEEQPSKSKSKTIIMKPPKSVGVESMDDEHVECTNSFNRVLKDPSYENLDELYTILKMHFEHEENLIGLYSPNSSGSSSFSKLTSHKMDHDRILSIAKNELERVENNAPSASASTSCSMPQPGQPRV